MVDVHDATAYSLEVVQTPLSSSAESLLKHYASLIIQRALDITKNACGRSSTFDRSLSKSVRSLNYRLFNKRFRHE